MTAEALHAFQQDVLYNRTLADKLRRIEDEDEFIAAMVTAAQQCGWDVQSEDVQASMNAARRQWIERWIA